MEILDASSSVAPGINEDSVDIYEGLDAEIVSNNEKLVPVSSGLKDSMDLYEDMVAEEQHNKESSYSELKSRFEAAQNQIKELHRRLKKMEIQNTGLSSENNRLKKNISALLRTARQEVVRKDAEIQRLTQRVHRFPLHQPQIQTVQDLKSAGRTSSTASLATACTQTPVNTQSKEECPLTDSTKPTTKEICYSSRSIKSLQQSCPKRQQEVAGRQSKPESHGSTDREETCRSQKLSEPTDGRLRDCLNHNRDSKQKQADKKDSHKNRTYKHVERHCRSDGAKTLSQDLLYSGASYEHKKEGSEVQRTDKSRTGSLEIIKGPSYKSIGSCGPELKQTPKSHRCDEWSNSKDKKSSSLKKSGKHSSDGTKPRERNRQKDYQRSMDRRCEGEIRRRHHRRSSSREREKRRAKVDMYKEGRCEKKSKEDNRSSEEPNLDGNNSVDDSNSNRKLCFMETLNLTLSPIKRHAAPRDGSPVELPTAEDDKDASAEENSQPNLNDMCVIDEIDSNELEAEPGQVAEQSVEDLKASGNEKICDKINLEDVKEDATNLAVLGSPPQRKGQDTAEDGGTAASPKSCPLEAAEDLKHCEEQLPLVTEKCQLEAAESSQLSDSPPSILEKQKTIEVQTSQPEHEAEGLEAVYSDETCVPPSVSREAAASPQLNNAKDAELMCEEAGARDQQHHNAGSPSVSQQGLCLPSSTSVSEENHHADQQERSKDLDSVSSTICMDSLPQENLNLTEAIYVMTQTETVRSSVCCIGVSKVSSTTEEDRSPWNHCTPTVTPKKICSQDRNTEPSSSVSIPHDEDSMMHTLSNLRRIPEAISPLRSPVQMGKRSVSHVHSKLGHVKSLQKDFSTSAAEVNSKKLDVNKDNKYPGSPANREAQNAVNMVSEHTLSHFDSELEEGEILSDNDEATSRAHVPATKRPKLTEPVRNNTSPQSLLGKKTEPCQITSKEPQDSSTFSTQSPRSRFKTVCPAASKSSFSTVEEIMETFKLVRTEMRKKYMKLHKTFPKKSFYGVMDNFQKSFMEFVDGAQFGQVCKDAEELKSRLRELIASVFSKVFNNGIVKRIFEQQAVNLKQKLWDFVDVQVDYLFLDIQTTLKSLCRLMRSPKEDKKSSGKAREPQQALVKNGQMCKQNESHSPNSSLNRSKLLAVVPYRTGLGSRGKDIRMSYTEKDSSSHVHPPQRTNAQTVANFLSSSNVAPSPEKHKMPPLVISQNGSVLDKTDFELLTEQQASSLTFNLVRDSQMGEIFKCLLQGSDLLESTGMPGDNVWSIGTPRKDEERFLGFATPSKFFSPSKSDASSRLIATWSSISPRKRSPCAKNQVPLNPALFDESCLLEVPSGNRALLQGSLSAEKYSILAEDLAVSLTIPSPLKSDSHLSFLQPPGVGIQVVSTPDSVISAHISEDALLDGEDATEQDIHLALDSCSSRESTNSENPGSALVFKPDVPMQALVMEKSSDHFIVKIRQMKVAAETTLIPEEPLNQTLTENNQQQGEDKGQRSQNDNSKCIAVPSENQISFTETTGGCRPNSGSQIQEPRGSTTDNPSDQRRYISAHSEKAPLSVSFNPSSPSSHSATLSDDARANLRVEVTPTNASKSHKQIGCPTGAFSSSHVPNISLSPNANLQSAGSQTTFYAWSRDETDGTNVCESEKSLTIDTSSSSEKTRKDCEHLRKRKRRQEKLKAKRYKREEKTLREVSPRRKSDKELNVSPVAVSPSSLSAKNIIKKKGEVVMAWTRDEDRAILMFLKTRGASRETFSTLSEKLNKPAGQIADRFYQLMKLFKKQEKMDT